VYGISPPILSMFEPKPWAVSLTGFRISVGFAHAVRFI
jgi:hypothetical protein